MAKFRYSLQSILDIKLKMETQAKQAFAAAKSALDDEEDALRQLFERKRGYEEKAKALLSGSLNVREIEDNKNALLVLDGYIAEQKQRVALAEKRLEKARMELTEVMMERKTHETLKEQAFQAFLQEENKAESKTVDELVSYTYGQKRQVKK
ncbi:MAG: flagellar export protein FliJ [Acetatifactor sp.]